MIAVAIFGGADGLDVFDKAFTTLFYVAAGDPWPESLPRWNGDGTTNWVVAGFIIVYTIVQARARALFRPSSARAPGRAGDSAAKGRQAEPV